MGLKYRLNKILGRSTMDFVDISYLMESVKSIAKKGIKVVAICLENTNSSYLGVKNATFNLFPENTLVLPAYYSNIKLNEKQFEELSKMIISEGFEQVIISTLPLSMNKLLDLLSDQICVKVIFHGALSELSDEVNEKQFFNMIELAKKGKIKKIGFVKSGLENWSHHLFEIKTNQLQLRPIKSIINPKIKSEKINIGIFGNTTFNKNIYNQIAGALAVENVIIHTSLNTKFSEIGFKDKIVIHPFMDHEIFLKLISQMDINLHLSFSEGMGGQVFTESLAQGVPCLTSYNNEYLRHDLELLNLLTVEQYENPWQITKAIEKVLEFDNEVLRSKLLAYSFLIEKESEMLLSAFLK
jgi:glycosyltransferase involved in cell wall biosynthesis